MSKTIKGMVVAAGLLAIVAMGCKGKAMTPKDGFNAWIAAIEKCDIPAIKAGMTKSSVDQMDAMVAQFAQFMPPEKQKDFDLYKEICKGFQPGSVQFVSETADENGTTAMIKYTKDGHDLDAPMRLEEGIWRLDMVGMMTRAATSKVPERPAGEPSVQPPVEPAPEPAAAQEPADEAPAEAPAGEAPAAAPAQ